MSSSRIQDVALPQTMTMRFGLWHPHPFQKDSKAVMKPDRGVSSQGSSSKKTSWRPPSSRS